MFEGALLNFFRTELGFEGHLYVRLSTKKLIRIIVLQAKADGFLPGGASLHSCMTPHGPDTKTYEVCLFYATQ